MSIAGRAIGVAMSIAIVTAACGASADDPETERGRVAHVYEQAIRTIVDEEIESTTTTDEEHRPVVYVTSLDGSHIGDEVQVRLFQELDDDMDLRVQDDKEQAIRPDDDDQAVRDEGILILVGTVPDEGDVVDLRVERYVSVLDRTELVMTVGFDGDEWSVTSTTVVADDG